MYIEYPVRDYFEEYTDDLTGLRVLDYGCNHANFLRYEPFAGEYTGLDIIPSIIEQNKRKYPQHKWLLLDKFNYQYRNEAVKEYWPDLEQYDVVLAYSVFTHTSFQEFKATIKKLKQHTPTVLATFMSTSDRQSLIKIFTNRPEYFDDPEELADMLMYRNRTFVACSKTDMGVDSYPPDTEYVLQFYDDEWIRKQFDAEVLKINENFDGALGVQRCLKI